MEGFNLFWDFAKDSTHEILNNKKMYLNAFLALVFLDNVETIYPLFQVGEDSATFYGLTIIATFLTFIVLSQIVLIQKRKRGGVGELKYFVPTFLLYNLYYSFLFFIGLFFLIIPGFYVLFYYSMVPFVAVLDDGANGSFFKLSKKLVKKNLPLIVWVTLTNLVVDISGLLLTPVKDPAVKMFSKLFFSIPDAFFTLVMTIVTVKTYYYLVNLRETATDNSQIPSSTGKGDEAPI